MIRYFSHCNRTLLKINEIPAPYLSQTATKKRRRNNLLYSNIILEHIASRLIALRSSECVCAFLTPSTSLLHSFFSLLVCALVYIGNVATVCRAATYIRNDTSSHTKTFFFFFFVISFFLFSHFIERIHWRGACDTFTYTRNQKVAHKKYSTNKHNTHRRKNKYNKNTTKMKMQINNNLRCWLTAANFQSRQLGLMTYTLFVVAIALNFHLLHRSPTFRWDFPIAGADTMVRRARVPTIRVDVCLAHILASIDLKWLLFCSCSIPSECCYVSMQSARTDWQAMR